MNINILRYSLFGIAGGQEIDRVTFLKFIIYPLAMIAILSASINNNNNILFCRKSTNQRGIKIYT